MIEKTDAELMFATQEEWDFYNKCVEGLPTREGINGNHLDKYGVEIPYGSAPHIAKHFKKAIEIVAFDNNLEAFFSFSNY